jgi:transketolase
LLLSLGVGRDHEVRMYGDMDDHDRAHGLDADALAAAIRAFVVG